MSNSVPNLWEYDMSLLTRARAIVPPATRPTDRRVLLAAAPVVALIVAAGIRVTGALLTEAAVAELRSVT